MAKNGARQQALRPNDGPGQKHAEDQKQQPGPMHPPLADPLLIQRDERPDGERVEMTERELIDQLA